METNDDPTVVTLKGDPSLKLVKTGTLNDDDGTPGLSEGDTISYSFTVRNDGNVTLTGVTVDDPKVGTVNGGPYTLAPGASEGFTASYEVTQDDIDLGSVENTATATGNPPSGDPVSDTSGTMETNDDPTVVTLERRPELTIEKTASQIQFTGPGEPINFTITVRNDGNVTLTGVSISDPMLEMTCLVGTLLPGDDFECSGEYLTQPADVVNGRVENTATATSDHTEEESATAVVIYPQSPVGSFSVVKSVTQQGFRAVGDVLNYTFVVTNTGSERLTGLTIDDPLTNDENESCPDTEIEPLGQVICTATYTVVQDDIDRGFVSNTAFFTTKETGPQPEQTNTVTVNAISCPVEAAALDQNPVLNNAGPVIAPMFASVEEPAAPVAELIIVPTSAGPVETPVWRAAPAEVMIVPTSGDPEGETGIAAADDIAPANPRERTPCEELVRRDITSLTHNFMVQRMNMIASFGPRLAWRNNRLDGFGDGSNGFNVTGENGDLTGNFAFSSEGMRRAFSGNKVVPTADAPAGEGGLRGWIEGSFAFYADDREDEDVKGDFFIGYAGIDFEVYERINIGIMGQIDWMDERGEGNGDINGDVEGTGWMIGPYLSAEVSDGLFLDMRAMYGRSDNSIDEQRQLETLLLERKGDFETERWLAEVTLSGNYDVGSVQLTPDVRFLYMREDQDDYVIDCTCGINELDGQTVEMSQLSGGLRISQLIETTDMTYRPYAVGRLLWNIDNPGELTVDGEYISTDDVRGAVTVGVDASSDRLQFGIEGTYDGLFAGGDYAIGGKLSLGYRF